MKPRGGLSLSTRWGDFYGYKLNLVAQSQLVGFWRKGLAFQQSPFALAETLQKRMHPFESRDTSFSVYSDGRSPLGAYASSLTLPPPYGRLWRPGRDSLLPHSRQGVAVRVGSSLHIVHRGCRPLRARDLLRFATVPRHLDRAV